MRKQPARQRGQFCRDHKDQHLVAQRVDAHGLGHLGAGAQRADRATGPRIQQRQQGRRRQQHQRPGQQEETAPLAQREAEQVQPRQTQQTVVLAQRFQVAHQVVQRQAPGDGRQRQVMARHAQRDGADDQRRRAADGQTDEQRQPRRQAGVQREPGTGVGADADKGRLPERGQAGHAGEQHQAHAGEAVQADVVQLGDPEIRQRQQGQGQQYGD